MNDFIAKTKDKLKEEGLEVSYLSITNSLRDGVRIGDAVVYFDKTKGNQYVARIFAPKDVKI